MTVTVDGRTLNITKDWIDIPDERFFRKEMEIFGQETIKIKENVIEPNKSQPIPTISIKPKKK
jgi:hypothetical protein